MSNSIQNSIQELADELKAFNRNDVLVNFLEKEQISLVDKQSEIDLPVEGELRKTIKKARTQFRESGASVFCLSKGILKWEWKGTICESPILLYPSQFKENRIKKQYEISWDLEEGFVNPFLKFQFQKEFDFSWDEIDFETSNWDEIQNQLSEKGFAISIENKNHFGNFHHHRFSVLRELESLAKVEGLNSTLQAIYGEKPLESKTNVLEKKNIFPADNDQLQIFENLQNDNLVVQGPPGTGKSQVLSNTLGKLLSSKQNTLVVSEKRVALEVLQQKLQTVGLNRFAFIQGENNNSQHLLEQLAVTWEFLESYSNDKSVEIDTAKFKLDGLQFKLNVLSDEKRVGGISYLNFLAHEAKYDLKSVEYKSNVPLISELQIHSETLIQLYQNNINTLCGFIPKSIVDSDEVFNYDAKVNAIENQWSALQKVKPFDSKEELQSIMKKAVFAQILKNEIHKDYFNILKSNSSDKKKFDRLSKKYFTLKKEVSNLEKADSDWINRPSIHETEELIEASSNASFFGRIKIKNRLKSLLKSSFSSPVEALKRNLDFQRKKQEFRIIEKKLTEIGVHTETEIHWVKDLLPKMNEQSWADYQEADTDKHSNLADVNDQLHSLYQNLRTYFKLGDYQSISQAFKSFHSHFSAFLENRKVLKDFDEKVYKILGESDSYSALEKTVLKSNWTEFVQQFPAFKEFDLNQIWGDLDEIILLEEKESNRFTQELILTKKEEFDALNNFLQVPARKLNPEEKERKVKLRRGRSLLIKEFGKTRSHPTIRELLESDAREWIYTLMPIWMVNPSQVGDFFPLEKNLFDHVLFDEATQIPLRNALGSLFRGNRALIMGDEHQMSPTEYFKSGDSEPIDLLHQVSYNWPKVMLKHHYRSQYPDLIAFSNKNFYEGELIAYPNAKGSNSAIEVHFVEDGIYVEQQNVIEAKKVAEAISNSLSKSEGSLGVVAFSEKQLKCIYSQLSSENQQLIDGRIDDNSAFFRALENVQGDECDHLIISLGYGKNEDGKLSLNFGPLNRKAGPRRLNVLFSRAKQKIDFFSSIEPKDLQLSDNDALNLMRQFLQTNSKSKENESIKFPLGLITKSVESSNNGAKVKFKNLIESISDANELLTLYRVLSDRGWEITF